MTNELETSGVDTPNVLDHAREFIDVVRRSAPAVYEDLSRQTRFASLLEQSNAFNHGKLFAYAEYVVFREEFQRRFPDASPAACINAFSRLLLKNDISMTNLLAALEGTRAEERRQLDRGT